MSLSDIPRNHFDPLSHFSSKEEHIPGYYPQSLPSPACLSHGFSQLPSTLYGHHPAAFNMNQPPSEEMSRYQELSDKYEPDLPGPLVSHKQSTDAIAIEYANADPTFVTKTAALAVTHPYSRIMKGDGNCGWRAIAFGYFENIFNLRDPAHAQREMLRIKSLNTLLDQTGQQEAMYEMFVDATMEAFESVLNAINRGERHDSFLVDLFNDGYNSTAIITHFRLLASAWMKLNHQQFQGFLSMPLNQYCSTRIEPVRTEIDEIGLRALIDVVIEGSGLLVQILYLDRSEGDAVTPHILTQPRPTTGAIRLLYRPGHYDLIYQVEPPLITQPVVNIQYGMSQNYSWDPNGFAFDIHPSLMAIPNMMMDSPYPNTPTPPMSQPPSDPYQALPPQEVYQPPMHTTPPPPPAPIPGMQIPVRLTGPPPVMTSLPPRSTEGAQIRLNPLVMEPNLSRSLPVTPPFKNSPFNVAHFANSDFQPIHFNPSEPRK
ncbi:peptidase C65 Otubain-domain-containing protein [Aspergillus karnatakaensis]|uniref:OTU family ubiquitin thioesterase n=1 Tax=Aspergillus karnatakaensis TaxID=1810916 RepID=UPI003CCC9D4D